MPRHRLTVLGAAWLALSWIPSLAAQTDPLRAITELVWQRRHDEARTLANDADLAPPQRALVEAAVLPPRERMHAMLALAQSHIDTEIADRALLAAVAAAACLREPSAAHPHLVDGDTGIPPSTPLPELDRHDTLHELGAALRTISILVERRRAAGGDAHILDAVEAAAASARASRHDKWLRVAPGRPIQIPAPRTEPLEVRVLPSTRELASRGDATGVPIAAPITIPEGRADATFAAPAPGIYVVELVSRRTGLARRRPLLVSAVALRTVVVADRAFALVERDDGTAPTPLADAEVTWIVEHPAVDDADADREHTTTLRATTDADGIARVVLPTRTRAIAVSTVTDFGSAFLRAETKQATGSDTQRDVQSIVDCRLDRTRHRPGETVHGRFVARIWHTDAELGRRLAIPSDTEYRVVLRQKSRVIAQTIGRTDDDGVGTFTLPTPTDAIDAIANVHIEWVDTSLPQPTSSSASTRLTTFRPPPLRIEQLDPDPLRADAPTPITLKVSYPTGIPAAHVPVWLSAKLRAFEDVVRTRSDATGRVHVALDAASLPSADGAAVGLGADWTTVSGLEWSQWSWPMPADDAHAAVRTRPANRGAELAFDDTATACVGTPVRIRARGRPGGTGILVVEGPPQPVAARVVFDADGNAQWSPTPTDAWWPHVVVHLSDHDARLRISIARRDSVASLALSTPERTFRAGESVTLELRALRADGGPAADANVAIAIVEAGVAERFGDVVRSWSHSLAPISHSRSHTTSALPLASPVQPIGDLMLDGGLFVAHRDASSLIGLGGEDNSRESAFSSERWRTPLDHDRTTLHFDGALRTDANGRAVVRVRLPDTDARWRVAASAIARGDVDSAEVVADLRAVQRLAIRPRLPRTLRAGDRLVGHVEIDVERATMPSGTPELRVEADRISARPTRPTAGPDAATKRAFEANVAVVAESGTREATVTTTVTLGAESRTVQTAIAIVEATPRRAPTDIASTGVSVTRTLERVDFVTGLDRDEIQRREVDRATAGVLHEIELTVTADELRESVRVRCPLPSGFVLYAPAASVEADDDAFTIRVGQLPPGATRTFRVLVVPGFAGNVAWPAVTIAIGDGVPEAVGATDHRLSIDAPTDDDPTTTIEMLGDERLAGSVRSASNRLAAADSDIARIAALNVVIGLPGDGGRAVLREHSDELVRAGGTAAEFVATTFADELANAETAFDERRASPLQLAVLLRHGDVATDAAARARSLAIVDAVLDPNTRHPIAPGTLWRLQVPQTLARVWHDAVVSASFRDGIAHDSTDAVAPELTALRPLLDAFAAALPHAPIDLREDARRLVGRLTPPRLRPSGGARGPNTTFAIERLAVHFDALLRTLDLAGQDDRANVAPIRQRLIAVLDGDAREARREAIVERLLRTRDTDGLMHVVDGMTDVTHPAAIASLRAIVERGTVAAARFAAGRMSPTAFESLPLELRLQRTDDPTRFAAAAREALRAGPAGVALLVGAIRNAPFDVVGDALATTLAEALGDPDVVSAFVRSRDQRVIVLTIEAALAAGIVDLQFPTSTPIARHAADVFRARAGDGVAAQRLRAAIPWRATMTDRALLRMLAIGLGTSATAADLIDGRLPFRVADLDGIAARTTTAEWARLLGSVDADRDATFARIQSAAVPDLADALWDRIRRREDEMPTLVRLLLAHPSTSEIPGERAATLPARLGRRVAEVVLDETGRPARYADGVIEPTDAASRARAIAARVRRGGIADLKAEEVATFASMCRLRGLPLGVDR